MLADYLRNAVEQVIAVAKARGFDPDFPSNSYSLRWMEPVAVGRWEGRRAERTEPAFWCVWRNLRVDDALRGSSAFKALQSYAGDFAAREGKFLPFHGKLMIEHQAEALLQDYFEKFGSLRIDEALLISVCNQYEADLRSKDVAVRAVYQVEQFKAQSPFALEEGLTFRPVNSSDIEAYARTSLDPFGLVPKAPGQHIFADAWICELERRVSKENMDGVNKFGEEIEDVVTALNLTIPGRALFLHLERGVMSPFLSIGRTLAGSQKIATSRIGDVVSLDQADVERFRKNFARIAQIGADDRLAQLRLPLRRLRMSSARAHDEDHIVDCVIALENLLACDSPSLETTFRFRLRGAAFLPDEFGTVVERIKLMDRLYRLRSRTVHGSKTAHGGGRKVDEIAAEMQKAAIEAESVLRAILLWYTERTHDPEKLGGVLEHLDEAMVTGGYRWAQAK